MTTRSKRKISVLLDPEEFDRFDGYCTQHGYKKSTLLARLIREHLEKEGIGLQQELFANDAERSLPS